MMMMTIYRAWIYPCCNSLLIVLERPQSSSWLFLLLMMHAGYACVAIVHWTLPWTTGSLSCTQIINACDCTGGCTDTERESALKVDSGKKIPCRTVQSNLCQWCDSLMLYSTELHPILMVTGHTVREYLASVWQKPSVVVATVYTLLYFFFFIASVYIT